ncbi:hypothetical protein BHE74_00003270 [Ensete ventricosum]|nr:hypothetical protein BHE74_00003270 [Ensete ventricosum]
MKYTLCFSLLFKTWYQSRLPRASSLLTVKRQQVSTVFDRVQKPSPTPFLPDLYFSTKTECFFQQRTQQNTHCPSYVADHTLLFIACHSHRQLRCSVRSSKRIAATNAALAIPYRYHCILCSSVYHSNLPAATLSPPSPLLPATQPCRWCPHRLSLPTAPSRFYCSRFQPAA